MDKFKCLITFESVIKTIFLSMKFHACGIDEKNSRPIIFLTMNKESIRNCRTRITKQKERKKKKHLIGNKTRYFPIFQKKKKKIKRPFTPTFILFKTCNHSLLYTDTTRTCSTVNSTLFSLLDENHKLRQPQWQL